MPHSNGTERGTIKRSISLPADLNRQLEQLARVNHRSFSAQVAFFCAGAVAPSKTECIGSAS